MKKLPEELSQAIEKFLPELIIDFNQEFNKWEWHFRCSSSGEDENFFDSPSSALAHFAMQAQEAVDQFLGTFDDDDKDVNDCDFEEYEEGKEF